MTIVAILLAPFIAIFAQRQVELWREIRHRRLWVFKTLMATRGTPMALDHVKALNMIDLEFTRKGDLDVRSSWKEYHDHLCSFPVGESGDQKEKIAVWTGKKEDLQAKVLEEMGRLVGYSFDSVQVKKGSYTPEGYGTVDFENQTIRRLLLEWLAGNREVGINLIPDSDEASKFGATFRKGILNVLEGREDLKVAVTEMPAAEQADAAGEAPPSRGPSGREATPTSMKEADD